MQRRYQGRKFQTGTGVGWDLDIICKMTNHLIRFRSAQEPGWDRNLSSNESLSAPFPNASKSAGSRSPFNAVPWTSCKIFATLKNYQQKDRGRILLISGHLIPRLSSTTANWASTTLEASTLPIQPTSSSRTSSTITNGKLRILRLRTASMVGIFLIFTNYLMLHEFLNGPSNFFSVSQTCSNEGMEFTLRTPDGFRGRIYTYKHYDRPHCYIRGK